MNDQEKFDEPQLPEKVDFQSDLNMEDIIDADYAQEFSKSLTKNVR